MSIKKISISIFIIFIFYLFSAIINKCLAVCPLCTVAVGAGVGLCRYLGIDDTISGVWIGGLTISSGLWLADFFKKKKIQNPYLPSASILLIFLLVIPFLYWGKLIGVVGNTLWGVDKLILGIIGGSLTFFLAVLTDKFLRKKNNNKVYFYYQKVIIPLLYLAFLSLIFYELTC